MTTCPHCGLPALSAWRKLLLGPAARVRCRRCGLAVGVAPLPALASFVPAALLVVAVLAGWMTRPATMVAAAALAIGFSALLYVTVVPLVPRQLTDARAVRSARDRAAGGG